MNPDIIPSADTLKILSIGHDTTFASVLWIQLIQYIGDNIGNGKYIEFTHKILQNIQTLHPRFTRAYEIDLLLLRAPVFDTTDDEREKIIKNMKEVLSYHEAALSQICNMQKVDQITAM